MRNIFKERKENAKLENERNLKKEEQLNRIRHKISTILADERWYDTTYVIYSSEFPNLSPSDIEKHVSWAVEKGHLKYEKRFYPDSFAFYIHVEKREEPKYNVGDIAHAIYISDKRKVDLMVLGRRYDGKGCYEYLLPTSDGFGWVGYND